LRIGTASDISGCVDWFPREIKGGAGNGVGVIGREFLGMGRRDGCVSRLTKPLHAYQLGRVLRFGGRGDGQRKLE
jgi:hypothetical protein